MTREAPLAFTTLRNAYRDGSLRPDILFADVLARVRAYDDPAVWLARVSEDDVLARARALPLDPAALDRLPLYGLPFAVKDNVDIAGLPTTAGCPEFAYVPAQTAFAVQRLIAAGAILIGKTNLDQFATGLTGTRSPHGAPRCVYDRAYISGGSSSGSAVAVAAGLCAFSLGTDTAGSGRVPAAFNNIVGLKPTRGLVSTSGVVPACRSLDCVSIFAASIADARAVALVAQGFDAGDPYSREARDSSLDTQHFRCGVLAAADRQFFGDTEAAQLYDRAVLRAQACGGEIVEFDFAAFRETAELLYGGPWVAERMAAIESFFASHDGAIEPTVRAIIGGARDYSAVDAFRGQYRLRALERRAAAQWGAIDVMLLPTTPTIYTVAEVMADPIGTNARLGSYTNFVNLLDYCAVAMPAGFRRNGLPFGVSLVGPAFADRDLARIAVRFACEAAAERSPSAWTEPVRERTARESAAPDGPARKMATPEGAAREIRIPDGEIGLAVAGAHLSGFPLNAQLLDLGATLVGTFVTNSGYRLFALANTSPPKPGLVRDPAYGGPGIEVEVWSLQPAAFGSFVAALPQPMGIGRVTLAGGVEVAGFLCERYALEGALEITSYGGWRAFCTQHA